MYWSVSKYTSVMKKILIILLLCVGFLFSQSQTLAINKFLHDSLISPGQRALFFDTTHLGQWKNISQQAGGGGGSGTPGGSNGQIQYNNAGSFGGTTTGTGVLTALGINVGSAGSFVTFGGALGTPSSANLTNAIGYLGANLVLTDITANNVTTSAHGFFPKLTSNTVYYVNNSGALVALPLGANGTVLTSNGATSAPTFTTPSGGGVTSVGSGYGLLGGPITTTGTLLVDSFSIATRLRVQKGIDSIGYLSIYRLLGGNNTTGGNGNFTSVTSGINNMALGSLLTANLTSGNNNILIGTNVGRRITVASDVVTIGYNNFQNYTGALANSGPAVQIGHDNNGYNNYKNLAIGNYNIGFNVDSVDAVKSYAIVADNMAIGTENLGNLRHGIDNMVFSWGGFETLDSGYNNVGVGQYVMGRLTAGHFNVAVGHGAGYRTTTGDRNIFVGDSSGYGAGPGTPMTGVTFLGSRTRFTGTNLYNRTAIGDSALVSQDNFIALGNTGTKVGIARATATESVHTDGAILIGAAAATTDGTIQWTGSDFQGRKGGAWKSFTAPSIADLTGLTSNSIYYVDNSGVITALPLGTIGKVLTTNGATSAPTWETPSAGSPAWNAISNPTGDQALTFDAGESSTWTNSNTTEDLFTINSSTVTTSSFFSLNRTSTALSTGNNILELVSSGASSGTATGQAITITNSGTTNIGLNISTSGATTNYSLVTNNFSILSTGAVEMLPTFENWYSVKAEFGGYAPTEGSFQVASSGTGSSFVGQATGLFAGWIGGLKGTTGTTNSGAIYAWFSTAASGYAQVVLDNSVRSNVGFKIRIDTLGDGTNSYDFGAGFTDNVANPVGATDGVYFRYRSSDSSGKWIMHTESNNSITEVTTSTTVTVDTDYTLEISVFGGTAYFYINKVLAGTISTNIPTGETRSTGIGVGLAKFAGTFARNLWVDWGAYGTRLN